MMIRTRILASAVTFSLLSFSATSAYAGWFKKPATANIQVPEPSHGAQVPQAIPFDPYAPSVPVPALPSVESQLSRIAAQRVALGDTHNGKTMLIEERRQDLSGVDACAGIPGQKNFLNSIEGAVRMGVVDRQIESNEFIDPAYGLPGTANSQPVSLLSNPLCIQDASQIAAILTPNFVPNAQVIAQLKTFSEASNADRKRALAGDTLALASFTMRMTQMMGCLSYEESLQTPEDDEVEDAFKSSVANMPEATRFFQDGAGVARRPRGVLFAEDRHGDFYNKLRAARANGSFTPELLNTLKQAYKPWPVVGVYQFNPKGGNTGPCVDQWNKMVDNPACKIEGSSPAAVMRALASPGQTFNTFCGVQKIVQAFNSQVNTNFLNGPKIVDGETLNTVGVDPSNIVNGVLKAPKDRCVSLVARSGYGNIYSHFGPLRNSVKDNLGKLIKCVSNLR
ncbi:MAG: hypothetical protein ABIR96_02440 [Bdellovibrionota bacterium]